MIFVPGDQTMLRSSVHELERVAPFSDMIEVSQERIQARTGTSFELEHWDHTVTCWGIDPIAVGDALLDWAEAWTVRPVALEPFAGSSETVVRVESFRGLVPPTTWDIKMTLATAGALDRWQPLGMVSIEHADCYGMYSFANDLAHQRVELGTTDPDRDRAARIGHEVTGLDFVVSPP